MYIYDINVVNLHMHSLISRVDRIKWTTYPHNKSHLNRSTTLVPARSVACIRWWPCSHNGSSRHSLIRATLKVQPCREAGKAKIWYCFDVRDITDLLHINDKVKNKPNHITHTKQFDSCRISRKCVDTWICWVMPIPNQNIFQIMQATWMQSICAKSTRKIAGTNSTHFFQIKTVGNN